MFTHFVVMLAFFLVVMRMLLLSLDVGCWPVPMIIMVLTLLSLYSLGSGLMAISAAIP